MPHERLTRVKTKIVATVGPACESAEMLTRLAEAGADIFRLNLAHGSPETHEVVLRRIQQVSAALRRPLAVLCDLAGPKIRLGEIAGGEMVCEVGATLELAAPHVSRPGALAVNHPELVGSLQSGDAVLLADGTVALSVRQAMGDYAVCRVEEGGPLRSRQGVHVPRPRLRLPALTDADREYVRWAALRTIDFLGYSFVSSRQDVEELRDEMKRCGCNADVVAKIERAAALDHLEAIIDAADAVMVARGDLGVEIDVARVPGVQKRIIRLCHERRVPVITATQMLDSMRLSNRPTRAEASDVANAILDGTDAVMLSGETAVGQYPVESVATMSRIAEEAERLLPAADPTCGRPDHAANRISDLTRAVVEGADRVARTLDAKLVIVASHTGRTALALSNCRNRIPTIASSDQEATLRRMCLYWGVTPLPPAQFGDSQALLHHALDWGRRQQIVKAGDRVVLVASTEWTTAGMNTVVVHEVT